VIDYVDLDAACLFNGALYGRGWSVEETTIKPEQLRCLPGRVIPPRCPTFNY
jgi:hypothetical protein